MTTIATRIMAAAVALMALSTIPAEPVSAQAGTTMGNPVGAWLTQSGHGVIRIEPCGQKLCGAIVGIELEPNETMPTDYAGRSQCGLNILTSSAEMTSGISNGKITDPRDGKTYDAQLWVDGSGKLHVRGYIGVPLLGQTQVWKPFSGHIYDGCKFA